LTSDLFGLYVHIPFCSVKCYYCDFTAVAHQGRSFDRYLGVLEREVAARLKRRPDTIYIGGGTPSELSAEQTARLFSFLPKGCSEVTFEANVESLTPAKLDALEKAGVTRLSLGLQTSEPALLKAIGRRHSVADFVDVYQRAQGRFSISVDLMYNLPGQSLASFAGSLGFVLGLKPQHFSVYGLQVEDQTLFSKRKVVPDEDLGRDMFELCLDTLALNGYEHYEISNWARPGARSAHNLNYWHDGEYLGVGCGAASYLNGVRSANLDRLPAYLEAENPIEESERLEGKHKLGESLMLGLRLIDGFQPTREMEAAFANEIAGLESRGLIERRDRLRLTRDGIFLANQVFREFVPPFTEAVTA
jgi:oxygen-independent coproporphyrinogen-3 oxidase